MTATIKPCYGTESEGCWFDNHRGIYMGEAVIETAVAHGFKCKEKVTPDHEYYCEIWDDAERFMDKFAADGYWFGGNESGDWGLWKCEEEGD